MNGNGEVGTQKAREKVKWGTISVLLHSFAMK
jgi:hypothetical protein